jgi:hypothetical protein
VRDQLEARYEARLKEKPPSPRLSRNRGEGIRGLRQGHAGERKRLGGKDVLVVYFLWVVTGSLSCGKSVNSPLSVKLFTCQRRNKLYYHFHSIQLYQTPFTCFSWSSSALINVYPRSEVHISLRTPLPQWREYPKKNEKCKEYSPSAIL